MSSVPSSFRLFTIIALRRFLPKTLALVSPFWRSRHSFPSYNHGIRMVAVYTSAASTADRHDPSSVSRFTRRNAQHESSIQARSNCDRYATLLCMLGFAPSAKTLAIPHFCLSTTIRQEASRALPYLPGLYLEPSSPPGHPYTELRLGFGRCRSSPSPDQESSAGVPTKHLSASYLWLFGSVDSVCIAG